MNKRILRRSFSGIALLAVFSATPLLAQEADLFVTKAADPEVAPAGSNVSFDVTITNSGPDDASFASLDDPIPAGMTFVSNTQNSGPVFTCSDPPVGSGGTISCSIATLGAGESANFTFVFQIPPATPPGTLFVNIATASSETFDPNDENDSGIAATSTPPPPTADMGVAKNSPSSAGPDTDVAFTISVTNAGTDDASSVLLEDTLPGNLTFVSIGQSGSPSLSCLTPAVGSGGTISCSAANFPAGDTVILTLTAHVPAGTASGTVYTNSATVSAETTDPNTENDVSQATLSVSSVDVSVTKSGPGTAMAGTDISYVLTVSNAGPDIAVDVDLVDTLPSGATFVSLTQDNGPAATTCSTPAPGTGGTVACSFATLGVTSAQFTLVMNTGSAASFTNTASVETDSFDTDGGNDTSSVDTAVTQSADVSVTKSGPAAVNAGSNVTYTVTVTNGGPSNATNVTLTDVLPAGTTFVSASQNSGPVFSCTTPAVGAGGTVTCDIATLPAGATATFTFVVNVPASATEPIENEASVSSATSDPDPDDNSATVPTQVIAAPVPPPVAEIPTLSPALLALFALVLAAAALLLQRTG